jgi:hypothetical protein
MIELGSVRAIELGIDPEWLCSPRSEAHDRPAKEDRPQSPGTH